eukprot:Rhum_TRINITY_DN14832_c21_g1::Rhum_TRINITY_DN14832_c21_g1_i1::g.124890::m.124890
MPGGMPVAPWRASPASFSASSPVLPFSFLLLLLLCGGGIPFTAAYEDHGLIIFWNANGIHEVDMNASLPVGSPPRTILAQPRGDDAAQLWPPVVGGLCVDPLSQVVVYTTNTHAGGTLRRTILLVELDGSTPTPLTVAELPTAAGDILYGCSINPTTRTISYVEFNEAEHRQRVSSVTFAGTKGARTFGAPKQGIGMRVQETHPQGGGLTQLADGTLFMTAAEKTASAAPSVPGLYKLGSTKFTYVASCATKGDWRGHLGYPVTQSDGSFIIADADDSSVPSASRDTTVLLVPADQATPISNAARSGVPLSPHVGDDAVPGETNIALSPTVAATSAAGSVLFLQGSPPGKIYSAEGLTGPKARPKFKAAYSELDAAGLGEYGIGPMVWTERSDLTFAPETPAPDTTEPTPAPAGVTAAPVAANATEAPANGTAAPGVNDTTSEPAASVATATLVDMATAAPAVTESPADVNYTAAPPVGEAECRAKTNRDDCVTRKGCGFVTQDELDALASLGAPAPPGIGGGSGAQVGVKGQCTLFGSLCGAQDSKARCQTLHYCFWRGADSPANADGGGTANTCEVSADCGEKLLLSTCTAPEWGGQCAWDSEARRCEPVEEEEMPSTEKTETLLLVYLAAIGAAICCLLVFCFAFWRAKKVGDKFDGRRKKTVWYKAVQEDEVQLTGELPPDDEGGVHDPDGAISLQESQQRARRDDAEREMDDWREKHLFDVQEVVPIGRGQMAATPTGSEEEGSDGDASDGFDADAAAAAATSWGLDGGGGASQARAGGGGGLDADLLGNESAPLERTEAEMELLRAIQKKKSEVEKGERLARGEARRGSRGPVDADAQSAAALTVASNRFGQQRRGAGASFRAGAGARGSGASDGKSGGGGALGPTDSSGGMNSSTASHPASPPVPASAAAASPSQRRSVANGRRTGPGSPVSPNPARASSSDLVADWAKDLPKAPGGGGSSSSPGSMRRRGEHKSPLLPRSSGGGGGGDDQYSPAVKHQSIRICDGLYPTLEEGMKELSPTSPSIKLASSKGSPKKKASMDDEGV